MTKENQIKLINDDCLKAMDVLIAEGITVDAIICDPPYLYIDYPKKNMI